MVKVAKIENNQYEDNLLTTTPIHYHYNKKKLYFNRIKYIYFFKILAFRMYFILYCMYVLYVPK